MHEDLDHVSGADNIYVCRRKGKYLVFPKGKGTTGYLAKCIKEEEISPGKWLTSIDWEGVILGGLIYESRDD